MEYVVYYAPGDRTWEEDLRGFDSEDEAWDWLRENRTCNICREQMAEEPGSDLAGCGEWWVTSWEKWLEVGGDPHIRRHDEPKYSVNLVAGSGATPNGWIFSRLTSEIQRWTAAHHRFDVTMTPTPDTSRRYDVYHYLHSTLAAQNPHMLHRAVVMVAALDDLDDHRTFASKREALDKTACVTAMCNLTLRELRDRGVPEHKLHYTPLGVPLDQFVPLPHPDYDSDVIRIGVVGRRYPDGRKGEDFMVAGVSRLASRLPETPLCLVFVGPNWDTHAGVIGLADLPNVSLEFHPDEPIETYPSLYASLDAVLVTSKTEGGPMCVMEALACGITVISTPGGYANEFLTRRDHQDESWLGRIVGYGDVPGLADALQQWVLDRHHFLRLDWHREFVSRVVRQADDLTHHPVDGSATDPHAPYDWEHCVSNFEALYRDIVDSLADRVVIEDHVTEEEPDDETYNEYTSRFLSTIFAENFSGIEHIVRKGLGVQDFPRLFEGLPLVIVGLGPSLDEAMPLLHAHRDRIAIMCGDAALPKLMREGLPPDVVVVVDPSNRQGANFAGIDCSGFVTMLPSIVHPTTFEEARRSRAKPVWFNTFDKDVPLCQYIPRIVGRKGAVFAGVLTSGAMIQIAQHLSAWPITFVGHDLCWYDLERGYASGTDPAKVEFQRQNKIMGKHVTTFPDVRGEMVRTEWCFTTFRSWLDEYLTNCDMRVYNSTGCGILHGERIDQMPLDRWLAEFAVEAIEPSPASRLIDRYVNLATTIGDWVLGPQYSPDVAERIRAGRCQPGD